MFVQTFEQLVGRVSFLKSYDLIKCTTKVGRASLTNNLVYETPE